MKSCTKRCPNSSLTVLCTMTTRLSGSLCRTQTFRFVGWVVMYVVRVVVWTSLALVQCVQALTSASVVGILVGVISFVRVDANPGDAALATSPQSCKVCTTIAIPRRLPSALRYTHSALVSAPLASKVECHVGTIWCKNSRQHCIAHEQR